MKQYDTIMHKIYYTSFPVTSL